MESNVLHLTTRSAFIGNGILHPMPTRPYKPSVGSLPLKQPSTTESFSQIPREVHTIHHSTAIPKHSLKRPLKKLILEDRRVDLHRGCNCKRSNCLKLYCECFTSKEYCKNCNCTGCYNNVQNDSARNLAIKEVLDRNPTAFRPKISPIRNSLPSSEFNDLDFAFQKNKVSLLIIARDVSVRSQGVLKNTVSVSKLGWYVQRIVNALIVRTMRSGRKRDQYKKQRIDFVHQLQLR